MSSFKLVKQLHTIHVWHIYLRFFDLYGIRHIYQSHGSYDNYTFIRYLLYDTQVWGLPPKKMLDKLPEMKMFVPGNSAGDLFGMVNTWPFQRMLVTSNQAVKRSL